MEQIQDLSIEQLRSALDHMEHNYSLALDHQDHGLAQSLYSYIVRLTDELYRRLTVEQDYAWEDRHTSLEAA